MTTIARTAANTADRSSEGSAWHSDPPMVPHSRTIGSATTRSASWKIGKHSPAAAESSRSACLASAPMRSSSPSRRMKASSVSPLMSTSSSGWASLSFIIGIRLCPPARTRVSGRVSNDSACWMLFARSYSTCEGTCMSAAADVLAPHLREALLELAHRGHAPGVVQEHDLHALAGQEAEVALERLRLPHDHPGDLEEQDRPAAHLA